MSSSEDPLEPAVVPFTLLREDNFPEWSVRTEAELIRRGLWALVMSYEDQVPDGLGGKELQSWIEKWLAGRSKAKMAEARAEIIRRVSDSQLVHLADRDPLVCWQVLMRVHRAHGFATRMSLRRQFYTAKKAPSESMQAWIARIKRLAFRLSHIGVKVDDEDIVLALTMGLDSSYDAFIISLDSTPPENLTAEHVVDRLTNEEVRRSGDMDPGTVGGVGKLVAAAAQSAYVVAGRSGAMGAGAGGASSGEVRVSDRSCWRCGQEGHIRAFCKTPIPDQVESFKSRGAANHVVHQDSHTMETMTDFGTRELGSLY